MQQVLATRHLIAPLVIIIKKKKIQGQSYECTPSQDIKMWSVKSTQGIFNVIKEKRKKQGQDAVIMTVLVNDF